MSADNVNLLTHSAFDAISLILAAAINTVLPDCKVYIEHAYGLDESPNFIGVRFSLYKKEISDISLTLCSKVQLTNENIIQLDETIASLIADKLPFIVDNVSKEEAREAFLCAGNPSTAALIMNMETSEVSICRFGSAVSLLSNSLSLPSSTEFIETILGNFTIESIPGSSSYCLHRTSSPIKPGEYQKVDESLIRVFESRFNSSTHSIGEVNNLITKGQQADVANAGKNTHIEQLEFIAKSILEKKTRVVFVGGPSSSGKTTFANRLCETISKLDSTTKTLCISVDNYYKSRSDPSHPRDRDGMLDFENLGALRLELLIENIKKLIHSKCIKGPQFDFKSGHPMEEVEEQYIGLNGVVVVEGIHGLNPEMDKEILNACKDDDSDSNLVARIFIAPLSTPRLTEINLMSHCTSRLIRRILRDFNHRGYSAEETIKRWDAVRRGEEAFIMPFVHRADFVFDSSHPAEIGIMAIKTKKLLIDFLVLSEEQLNELELQEKIEIQAQAAANETENSGLPRQQGKKISLANEMELNRLDEKKRTSMNQPQVMIKEEETEEIESSPRSNVSAVRGQVEIARQLLMLLSFSEKFEASFVEDESLLREFIGDRSRDNEGWEIHDTNHGCFEKRNLHWLCC